MIHALGIDLEDWYLDVAQHARRSARPALAALDRQVAVLRHILDAARTRCTFFVLGTTARRHAGLVPDLLPGSPRDRSAVRARGSGPGT